MRVIKIVIFFLVVAFLSACAGAKYKGEAINVDPENPDFSVVVVRNDATKEGFLNSIKKWLRKNNYKYTVKPEGESHDTSKLTIEYVGLWSWDLILYLSKAKLDAYYENQKIGEVSYEASYMSFNKFSEASDRIDYMLEILFGKITAEEATKAIEKSKKK